MKGDTFVLFRMVLDLLTAWFTLPHCTTTVKGDKFVLIMMVWDLLTLWFTLPRCTTNVKGDNVRVLIMGVNCSVHTSLLRYS